MSLRPKTQRRLLIILSVCAVLGGALVWAQRARQQKEVVRVEALRAGGIAAHDRGDHLAALADLSEYLAAVKVDQHEPADAELDALYAFADARRRLRVDDSAKHLDEARQYLERYLRYRPADDKARRLLLDVHAKSSRHRDAATVANDILLTAPDNREALYAKARALRLLQPKPELAQAREAVDRLLKVDPANFKGLMLSLDLRLATGTPPEAVAEQAAGWAADHPGEPVYQLVAARTYLMLARGAAAAPAATVPATSPALTRQVVWFDRAKVAAMAAAAAIPPADPAVVEQIAAALEKVGEFGRVLPYLRGAADRVPRPDRPAGPDHLADVNLDRSLVRRLWQSMGYDEVLRRTAALDLKSPAADVELLGFRALASLAVAAGSPGSPGSSGSPGSDDPQDRAGPPATTSATGPSSAPTAPAMAAPVATLPAPPATSTRDRNGLLNEVGAIAAALAGRAHDLDAEAWALLLQTESRAVPAAGAAGLTAPASAAPLTATEQLGRYRQANAKDRTNMVIVARLGDALAAVGEGEPAVQAWADAGERWEWAQPFARIAVRRLQEGRVGEAERAAFLAHVRQPDHRPFEALWLQARFAALGRPGGPSDRPAAADKLLADVQAFQRRYPNDPDTLRVEVALLGRLRGPAAAAERVQAALTATPPLPADALQQLLTVDKAENLGVAAAVEAALGNREGGSSRLAVRRANDLLDQGKPQDGLAVLRDAERQQPGLADDPGWQLAAAAYRDRANDPSAARALAAVGDRFPADPAVQGGLLSVPGLRRDRELWRRTIDRVKALTGDDGTVWRAERAQWLLAANAGQTERREAVDLLAQVAKRNRTSFDARRLLGRALLADAQYPRAAEELAAAAALRPDHVQAALELVAAHRLAKQPTEAVAVLTRLSASPALAPDQRQRVAQLYEELGYPEAAVKTLLVLPPGGPREARLARLYRALGRGPEAEAAYKAVLNDDAVQPQDLYAGADYFAANGRPDFARLYLDRLRTVSPSPAVTELLLGQYEEAYGSADAARGHLAKATELEPANPLAWRALAGFHLRAGRPEEADRAVEAGLAAATAAASPTPAATAGSGPAPIPAPAAPARDELVAMKTVVQIARRLPEAQRSAMLQLLSRDPQNVAAAAALAAQADGAAAVAAAGTDPAARAAAVRAAQGKVAEAAARYPDFWPLQREVIVRQLQAGQTEQAAAAAWKAVPAFPWTPEPARLAAEAYAALGRWGNVVDAATAWRQRSGGDPVPADVMMAEALLAQRQPLLALRRLEAHVRANPLPAAGSDGAAGGTPETRPATGPIDPSVTLPSATAPTATAPSPSPVVRPSTLALYRTYGRALITAGREVEAADALARLPALGAEGRSAWLALAGAHKSAAAAKAWVEKGAATLPADAPADQRLAVAAAYFEAGRRTGDASLLAQAADAVEPLTAGDAPSPAALTVKAQAAHFLGDYATAEQSWRLVRRAVASPEPDALNNLAYVLLVRGDPKDLPEATRLAEQAVAASPDVPAYVGTLALARSRAGDRPNALQGYRQVLAKDADNVDALLGLAAELLRGSAAAERAEAKRLLVQARKLLDQGGLQPPEVRKQLDVLAGAVESSDAGGR